MGACSKLGTPLGERAVSDIVQLQKTTLSSDTPQHPAKAELPAPWVVHRGHRSRLLGANRAPGRWQHEVLGPCYHDGDL